MNSSLLEKVRFGFRLGYAKAIDFMAREVLWCAFNDYHMG